MVMIIIMSSDNRVQHQDTVVNNLLTNAMVPMMSIKTTTAASMPTPIDRIASDDVPVKTVAVVAIACVAVIAGRSVITAPELPRTYIGGLSIYNYI